MASLIDELINVLNTENDEYRVLLKLSHEKTPIIVRGDVDALKDMTLKEQTHLDTVLKLEKKRQEVIIDMATVLNLNKEDITVKKLVNVLGGQPEVQKRLSLVHDELIVTLKNFNVVNELNKQLLKDSLEMNEFNLNLIRNRDQAPETANYNSNSNYAGENEMTTQGLFDAKQ